MSKPISDLSAWTSHCAFHFESNSSLEDVVESLTDLETKFGLLNTSHSHMAILLIRDGYTFRYRIRRSSKGRLYTTAVGEGQIWQAEDGPVVVEGQAQIEPWGFYSVMGLCLLIAILFIFAGSVGLPLLLLPIAAAYMIISYCGDRNLVVMNIRQAVAKTHNGTETVGKHKEKRAASAEKLKIAPVREKVKMSTIAEESVRTVSLCDTIWNEAISEYDSSSQE